MEHPSSPAHTLRCADSRRGQRTRPGRPRFVRRSRVHRIARSAGRLQPVARHAWFWLLAREPRAGRTRGRLARRLGRLAQRLEQASLAVRLASPAVITWCTALSCVSCRLKIERYSRLYSPLPPLHVTLHVTKAVLDHVSPPFEHSVAMCTRQHIPFTLARRRGVRSNAGSGPPPGCNDHRAGHAKLALNGRYSAQAAAPRRARRETSANHHSNYPRGDLRHAKVDHFATIEQRAVVADDRAPSSARRRRDAHNAVPDDL